MRKCGAPDRDRDLLLSDWIAVGSVEIASHSPFALSASHGLVFYAELAASPLPLENSILGSLSAALTFDLSLLRFCWFALRVGATTPQLQQHFVLG